MTSPTAVPVSVESGLHQCLADDHCCRHCLSSTCRPGDNAPDDTGQEL